MCTVVGTEFANSCQTLSISLKYFRHPRQAIYHSSISLPSVSESLIPAYLQTCTTLNRAPFSSLLLQQLPNMVSTNLETNSLPVPEDKRTAKEAMANGGSKADSVADIKYLTGVKLLLCLGSITLIAFLMLLDQSILATVRSSRVP